MSRLASHTVSAQTRRVSAVQLSLILSALFSSQEKMENASKVGAKQNTACTFSEVVHISGGLGEKMCLFQNYDNK